MTKAIVPFVIVIFMTFGTKEGGELLKIPQGFPEPFIPADNSITKYRIELGKALFFDTILSRDSTISCASCHIPEFAFTDRKPKGVGIRGQVVSRNTPTLTNVVYQEAFLWDGLNPSLEAQVNIPIHETNEFDFSILLVAERMKKNPYYVALSKAAYNCEPDPSVITKAIATYERTLISGNSSYDQFTYQNDSTALNSSQKRGKNLFFEELYCAGCHNGFNFTNGSLTNNGLYQHYADSGRMRLFGHEKDRAIFKVPTLRNIALTYPYMHDGSINSIEEVINHYASGGKPHPNKSKIITPFDISQEQKIDLIAFLNSLTDSSFLSLNE